MVRSVSNKNCVPIGKKVVQLLAQPFFKKFFLFSACREACLMSQIAQTE
jgi:hypothetical protein